MGDMDMVIVTVEIAGLAFMKPSLLCPETPDKCAADSNAGNETWTVFVYSGGEN
jgi:hypothetical protein